MANINYTEDKWVLSAEVVYASDTVLSTCPLHINWSMVISAKAAPVTGTTLRTTGPVSVDSRQ